MYAPGRHASAGSRFLALCLVTALALDAAVCAGSAKPAAKPLRVGCYYFPGWFCADRWAPIVEYGGREPIIGCYRDELPAVQDWHIRQATQHGISFWVFDWYYNYRTGEVLGHNAALDKGFLHASLRRKMDFALMWCNEEPGQPDYTEADLMRLVRTIGARYLSQPNYLRVAGGRNVLVVSRPDRLISRFGAAGARAMLQKMSDAARPWGGLFFACIQNPTASMLRDLGAAGFDACTYYCYAAEGVKPGQTEAPYDAILPAVEPTWRRAAQGRELPIIPCVSPGWDSRAWYGDRGLARTGCSPEKFGRLCSTMKRFVDPKLGLAMVGTWNEFGEGTYVEPTKERGCGMLDAMQRAFFAGARPHRMLTPTVSERTALDYDYVPAHLEEQIARQGGNLVINPGFEHDWGWAYFDGAPAVYATGKAHGGRRAVVLTRARGGLKSLALAPGVAWPFRSLNRVPVEGGRSYLVSAWVNGKAQVAVALFGKDGGWLGRSQAVAEGGRSGEWRKLEAVIIVTDQEAASFDFEVVPADDTVYVDDVGVWRR